MTRPANRTRRATEKETSHVGPIDDDYKLDDESATRKIVDHTFNISERRVRTKKKDEKNVVG